MYFFIIDAYANLGRHEELIQYLTKSINYINENDRLKLNAPLVNYFIAYDYMLKNDYLNAEIYFKKRKYEKAKTVCNLGLQSNPNNYVGYYILSKIMLVNGKIIQAEKTLKKVVEHDPLNTNALLTFIEVLITLKRSSNTINKYIMKAHKRLPNNVEVIKLYNKISTNKKNKKKIKKNIIIKNKKITINAKLATKTMYQLMKKQKQYNVAKDILDILTVCGLKFYGKGMKKKK